MWRTTDIFNNNCGCFIYCKRERIEGKGRRLFPQIGGFLQKCCRRRNENTSVRRFSERDWLSCESVNTLSDHYKSSPGGHVCGADRPCVVQHRGADFEEAKTNCNSTPILISQLPRPEPWHKTFTHTQRTQTNTCTEGEVVFVTGDGGTKGGPWLADNMLIRLNNNQCLCIRGAGTGCYPGAGVWSPLNTPVPLQFKRYSERHNYCCLLSLPDTLAGGNGL